MPSIRTRALGIAMTLTLLATAPAAFGNALREKGKPVTISKSTLSVTPSRDWNRLSLSPGKNTELWTLDGEQLNDVLFFAGIEPGKPLLREVNKRSKPLPKFTRETLLVEVPELFEGTIRASREIATFTTSAVTPDRFLGQNGIRFSFDYVDGDGLRRMGEGRAALVNGLLYMATFDAPRLHYYDRTLADFRALADSARLN